MRVRERAVAGSRLRSAAVRRNPTLVGNGVLFFEFEVPALVRRDDLRAFGAWLASPSCGTVH
jgi:hypothetical protein